MEFASLLAKESERRGCELQVVVDFPDLVAVRAVLSIKYEGKKEGVASCCIISTRAFL